jgi:hypothetical protein
MAEASPDPPREPADHHIYGLVMFDRDSLKFFLNAVKFYESLVDAGIRSVQNDAELSALLDEDTLESYAVGRELSNTRRARAWLERHIQRAGTARWVDISIGHDMVRFLKSVHLLHLEHLRRKRDVIASIPTTPKALLEALDQQLARFEERVGQGVFRVASPHPLVLDQLPPVTTEAGGPTREPTPTASMPVVRPRAVVLDSIEIRDPELRRRCLDLLAQFHQDGEHDRLDTVVSEATRILEDRLRALAGAEAGVSGIDLAAFAFRPPQARLGVSEVTAEQEAAHLLYRGVFGFVRNSAHHRLLGELQAERVLQIVGMVDFLISVAEAARRNLSGASAQ